MAAIKHDAQIAMNAPPTAPNHVVRLEDMEKRIEGLSWDPVTAIATENIAGTMSADALMLTGNENGVLPSQDGITPEAGMRFLLAFQTDKSENGIYEVVELGDATAPYVLKRTGDADVGGEFRPNKSVYIQPDGVRYGGQTWKQVTGSAVILGTTGIELIHDLDTNKVLPYKGTFTADGSATEFDIVHSLNTRHVKIEVHDEAGDVRNFAVTVVDVNTVRLSAGYVIPADTEFQVTVFGQPDA